MTYFKHSSNTFLAELKKVSINLNRNNRFPSNDSKAGPLKYKTGQRHYPDI